METIQFYYKGYRMDLVSGGREYHYQNSVSERTMAFKKKLINVPVGVLVTATVREEDEKGVKTVGAPFTADFSQRHTNHNLWQAQQAADSVIIESRKEAEKHELLDKFELILSRLINGMNRQQKAAFITKYIIKHAL